MIENNTTTSVIDPTQELRIIPNHRHPDTISTRRAWAMILMAAGLLAAGVAPMHSSESQTSAKAGVVQVIEIEHRGSTVDRSARVALSRSQKIEKVIKYAMAQRGDRYVWGASGPSRWDCSGIVSVAFKKGAGVRLPHFTGGIQKKGYKVAKKNLKRGDIIFPQRGHVGIYLGNGKMIHASSSKGKVVVAKVYGFYTARRVI